MNKSPWRRVAVIALAVQAFAASGRAQAGRFPSRSSRAELFAPGVISTRDYERDGAFTPDGQTFYFTKRTMWPGFSAICVSRLRGGRWTEPKVASFSGQYADLTPFVADDGTRIYFASQRPVGGARAGYQIWRAQRVGDTWADPEPLPAPINGRGGVVAPVVTRSGSLYFIRVADARLMVAVARPGGWEDPMPVTDSASAAGTAEVGVYVDPDERYMFVAIAGRDDALHTAEGIYPRADLYVRERAGTHWGPLRHLPSPINTGAEEESPTVSPDRKYLYFTSERGVFTEHGTRYDAVGLERALHQPGNGLGDIYRIDLRATGVRP